MRKLLLKNGILVSSSGEERMDLLIEEGRVAAIEPNIPIENTVELIDCSGRFILPGAIDVHVHLRTPGAEHKEDWTTGTQAAAAGGVTTILDMPNNIPAITNSSLLDEKRRLIRGTSYVNYGLYMGATVDAPTGHTNIDEYLDSNAVALKVYMGSSTGNLLVDKKQSLEAIFEGAAATDRLICAHAEDESILRRNEVRFRQQYGDDPDPSIHADVREPLAAYEAVKFALHLQKKYGTRLHICHLSTQLELKEILKFRSDRVSCEVTPHHLFLDRFELSREKHGNFARMNPPLRTHEDNVALLTALRSGPIDMVSTDHAPHTLNEKEVSYWEAPSGVPGLETMLPLLLDAVNHGALNLTDVVRVTSEGPAGVFRLFDDAGFSLGQLRKGVRADLVVVDMSLRQTVANGGSGAFYTKCGWSVFSGRVLQGWPVMTVVNGHIVMRDGRTIGDPVGYEVFAKM